jgi:YHS domain-containing protein
MNVRYACILALVLALGGVACSAKDHGAPQAAETPKIGVEQLALKVDPYCGMKLEGHELAATADYKGKTYGFCSTYCKDEFDKDPEKYLANPGQGGMK